MVSIENIIGMTEEEAIGYLGKSHTLRTVRLNGTDLIVTAEYWPDRINIAIDNDKITEIVSIG